jgi:hypothetical protein
MLTLTKDQYQEMLRDNICTVVFTKKDGTERTMRCTLKQDVIEGNDLVPVGSGIIVPDYQVRCIDVEKKAWRSFNIDTVVSFEVDIEQPQ